MIFRNFPILKGKIWKVWYTYLGSKVVPGLRFMNYGYYKDSFCPDLSVNDEKERYPIHYLLKNRNKNFFIETKC